MVQDNHAECKNAILGLLDALSRIKRMLEASGSGADVQESIRQLAEQAIARHGPILPRL